MTPVIYEPRETNFAHNGLGRLSEAIRCDVTEEANGKYELELEYPAISRFSNYFENGYQIKAKPNDLEEYHVFEIKQTYKDTFTNTVVVYAQSRTYKLGNRQVQYVEIKSANGREAMKAIEDGMDAPCDVKLYSDIPTISSTIFEVRNALNCIAGEQGSLLQYWGGEMKREPFKFSLLQRRGKDNVGTVRYGKDLNGLKIKFDWTSIVTKVLPYADLQDGNDGKTKRIYGSPVLSEYMNNYPDIYARYIQFTEEQGVTSVASLNKIAKNYFSTLNPGSDKPKVNIELEIEKLSDSEEAKEFAKIRNYGLFDTFKLYHKLYDIDINTKVNGIVYDSLLEKNKGIITGDIAVAFYKQQNYDFQETIKTLTKKGYMSEFIDYITDLINGVKGGSILQYPKNKPNSMYFMDTDSTDTAKDVIVINNQGIGFSRTGWKGPFKNAWTIDGVLNADFIKSGTLEGVVVRSINKDKTGRIDLVNGHINFYDFTSGRLIGSISPTSSSSSAGINISPEKGRYIDITDGEGTPIFNIPENSSQKNPRLNTYGKWTHKGELHVDKLFVGGKEITGNGSGGGGGNTGGWNGQYPSEVKTDAEKFAWQAWVTLLSLGYSKAAAAGILGNINGEAGPSMNPDTEQVGGPAYGAVQFDGSSYPLIGSPTNNGREYFQRLHKASGAGGDYREMSPQMKVVDWGMTNGQWIGRANPTSVGGFKAMTSPEQAAYVFEENYERPANAHPERQGYARTWYDKFVNLAIPSSDWLTPVRESYVVTQEWDEIGWGTSVIHGGIDLAPTNGGNPPIYAAKAGTVIVVGNNVALEGNYVMIDHKDGYYTYYGHMVDGSVKVSNGQTVTNQTVLGLMGSTGLASGVHLHFEVRKGGQSSNFRINPRDVIKF